MPIHYEYDTPGMKYRFYDTNTGEINEVDLRSPIQQVRYYADSICDSRTSTLEQELRNEFNQKLDAWARKIYQTITERIPIEITEEEFMDVLYRS